MTRLATIEDMPHILCMAREFFNYSVYSGVEYDEEAVRVFLEGLLTDGCIFVNERGFIAGALMPLFFAPQVLIAHEAAWWAPAGGGRELREAFESWAKAMGASGTKMASLNNSSAEKIASNLALSGYMPVEINYLKVL
jgi:hypothetical protein